MWLRICHESSQSEERDERAAEATLVRVGAQVGHEVVGSQERERCLNRGCPLRLLIRTSQKVVTSEGFETEAA